LARGRIGRHEEISRIGTSNTWRTKPKGKETKRKMRRFKKKQQQE
jgi:hypothetical protein